VKYLAAGVVAGLVAALAYQFFKPRYHAAIETNFEVPYTYDPGLVETLERALRERYT
jgi:hypothetical protein